MVVVVRMLIFHGTPICNICIRLAVRVCREKKMQGGRARGGRGRRKGGRDEEKEREREREGGGGVVVGREKCFPLS